MSSIILKTREEIELMRESALIVSKTLGMIASEIKDLELLLYILDKRAEEFIRDHGAVPSISLDMYGFPKFTLYESQFPSGARYSYR